MGVSATATRQTDSKRSGNRVTDDRRGTVHSRVVNGVQRDYVRAIAGDLRSLICRRRAERREVLHATGKTGAGSGYGPKRRSWSSFVEC